MSDESWLSRRKLHVLDAQLPINMWRGRERLKFCDGNRNSSMASVKPPKFNCSIHLILPTLKRHLLVGKYVELIPA